MIGYFVARDLLPYCVQVGILRDIKDICRIVVIIHYAVLRLFLNRVPAQEGIAFGLHLAGAEYGYFCSADVRALRVYRRCGSFLQHLMVGHFIKRGPYCVQLRIIPDYKGICGIVVCIYYSVLRLRLNRVPAQEHMVFGFHCALIEYSHGRSRCIRALCVSLRSGRAVECLIIGYLYLRHPYSKQVSILRNLKGIRRIVVRIYYSVLCLRLNRVPALEYIIGRFHRTLSEYSHFASDHIRAVGIYRCNTTRKRDNRIISNLVKRSPNCEQIGILLNYKCASGAILDGSGFCFILV